MLYKLFILERGRRLLSNKLIEAIENSPIIAAISDMDGLEKSLATESKVIFILFGDICNISDIVDRVKATEKIAMVHVDLIAGLSSKEISIDFIKKYTNADGIITTKPTLIKRAKELSLYTILRFFVIDSLALKNVVKQLNSTKPDYVEILPGLMPKVIKKISMLTQIPIIAGGLIADKEDVISILSNGAISISTTDQHVWFM